MSVRFDIGTDAITYAGSNPPDPASGFTVTMWARVKVDTNGNATLARIHANSGADTSATFATDSDGLAGPGYFTGGGSVLNTLGFAVDAWRKVAFTRSGSTGRVYAATVGGATVLTSGTVGGAATPTGFTVGGRSASDASEFFNGSIAYVRYWSTQLTQTQIEAEWASATAVVTSGLWGSWPLLVHTNLQDVSGNGRHLVAGGTSTTTEDDPPLANTVVGTMAGSWAGTTGTLVGHRVVYGTMAGLWAGTSGRLTEGSGAQAGAGGGWETLLAISREARALYAEDAARVPVSCPNDGEPLRTAPDGGLFCIWDGWRPGV